MTHCHPLIHTWYLPTTFGDIRLVDEGEFTKVEICKLTQAELEAVLALRKRSLGSLVRPAWATEEDWERVVLKPHQPSTSVVQLRAPIAKIEAVLTKALRKDRRTISVLTTKHGEYIEFKADRAEDHGDVYRSEPTAIVATTTPARATAAAVTVNEPVIGCPAPDFEQAEIRATQVLRAFLRPEQIDDFERRQQFVTIGAQTGHRYAITSRHARSRLATTSRTVYDLDEEQPYCVHDWDVPAAEEMLTMHLLLSLPGWEMHVRGMAEYE